MPINLTKIQERRKTVTVDMGDGDTFDVTYRPAVYTSDFESEIRTKAQEGDKDVVGHLLSRLIEDWDVYEDEKQKAKVPLVPERIASLPLILLLPTIEAINKDMRPNSKTESSFSAG